MKRKKLIFKLVLVLGLIFLAAAAFKISQTIDEETAERRMQRKKDEKIAEITNLYQKYLNETANTIAASQVDQKLISQINSYVFNKQPKTLLYLWMSDKDGNFVFGAPSADFTNLNKVFDKLNTSDETKKETYFVDRNDFLMKTIGQDDAIDIVVPGADVHIDDVGSPGEVGPMPQIRISSDLQFRLPRGQSDMIVLSSPIIDKEGKIAGELFLKVDDTEIKEIGNYRNGIFIETDFPIARFIMGVTGFFLWLLIPSWVYIDARQRDVKRAFLWALLTVITFGFALAVYLVARPAAVKSFLCPECEKELNGTKAFCPYCGHDLSSSFCPQCQYQVKGDWQFCPNCRYDLTRKPDKKSAGKDLQLKQDTPQNQGAESKEAKKERKEKEKEVEKETAKEKEKK